MDSEQEAKKIASRRNQLQREQSVRTQKHLTLDEIGRRIALGDFQEINVIVKGDVDGSIEALSDSLEQLSTDAIKVNIIQKAVGKTSGKTSLEVNTKMPTTSTMAKHWKSGRFSNEKWDQNITVEMTTLDDLIKIYGLPSYIKIDVEGFELDVLIGLSQKAGIISFEFTSEFLDQTINCLDHLKKIGYHEYNFSIGERRKFYSQWSNTEELIQKLRNEIMNDELLWGDIYCK